ncbi:MAG: mechanosensitive ion channel, partial [Blastocatellia bacterium]|nr:mechanosensitive ion channel [Blastocatellia bacterium]
MKLFLLAATVFWLAASIFGMAQTADPNAGATAGTEGHEDHEAAPLIFWNRKITIFRASYDQLNPAERAANAAARLEALPEQSTWKVDAIEVPYGRTPRALISVNNKLAFIIMPEDLDPESGDTLKDAADHAVTQLRATLEARARQRNMPLLLQAIGLSLVATLIALFAFSLVIRASTRSLSWLERFAEERARPVAIAGVNLRPMTMVLKRIAIKIIAWAAGITLGYLWLTFVLMRFPYSQPWGEQLGTFLTNLFGKLTSGALYSIPGIFTVLIIYLMARIVAQLTSSVFHEVEARGQPIAWIHPDTARATRRILVALIWIFALIIAYPYIPGSNTEAFKGVSVFVGLMISLGSAGLINQIMSGLVVIYSRALKAGEYVRVGD